MEHTQQVQYPAVRLSIVGDVALSSRFGTFETSQRFTTNTYADKKPPCNESFVRLSKGEESIYVDSALFLYRRNLPIEGVPMCTRVLTCD